jgi:hypothetical protein
MKTLIIALFALFTTVVYADLYEDQFNTLQGQYNNAIKEYNRKYATALQPMLEKAQKDGNVELYNKIRQTLFDIGHPIDADWFIGIIDIQDKDSAVTTRRYKFSIDNTVTFVDRLDGTTGLMPPGEIGTYTVLNDGSIKATIGKHIIFTLEKKGNKMISVRWKPEDFPNPTKSVTSISVVKAE